jgi:Tol biopolymer transport system component
MTTEQRLERDLPAILGDLAIAPYPDYIDDVLATTAQRRQRPAWTFPERWILMDVTTTRVPTVRLPWRQLGVVALIAILVATALAVYVGRQRPLPPPFGLAANGAIPYASDGDIFLGDVTARTSRLLLGGPAYDFDPVFSRDGTRILFARRVDPVASEPYHLMVMSDDGSDVRQVTGEPAQAPIWWDWAPDGRGVVLVDELAGVGVFTLLDPEGAAAPRVMVEGISVDVPVYRPPDSGQILFRGQIGQRAGLWVMNVDGSNLHPLIEPAPSRNLGVTLMEPRYSPDGSQIAYQQWDDAADVMRLYVMDADGSNPREVGATPGIWFTGWPVWSNDGTKIAVQRARGTSASGVSLPYAIIDVRSETIIETGPAPSCCRVEWAPDDSALLFLQEIGGVSRQLLLDPDGGPATELPWTSDSYPSWQRLAP